MDLIPICLFLINVGLQCSAISIEEQLKHVIRRRAESLGLMRNGLIPILTRRGFSVIQDGSADILGNPELPSHLPPSEPILPGHTLLRPAFGMLKSAVKFPHKDLVDGSGIYGNLRSLLSMKYDGLDERVLYNSFRRNNEIQQGSKVADVILSILNNRRDQRPKTGFLKKIHHRRFMPLENNDLVNKGLKNYLIMMRRNEEMKKNPENNMFGNTRKFLSERPISFNLDKSVTTNQQTSSVEKENKENIPIKLARKADKITFCDSIEMRPDNWMEILKDRFLVKKIDMTKPTYLELFPYKEKGIGRQGSQPVPVERLNTNLVKNAKLYTHMTMYPDFEEIFDHL